MTPHRPFTGRHPAPSDQSGPGIVIFPIPMRDGGRRRDYRGRGIRGPVLAPGLPAAGTRAEIFEGHVQAAIARLERGWADHMKDIEFTVQLIPLSEPAPWEGHEVPLGRIFPAHDGLKTQIVLYRRPIEARAMDEDDLGLLVLDIVVEQLARVLGRRPEEIDPGFGL